MVIHLTLTAKIVKVGTVFLYGNNEEEFFMECPQGMTHVSKDDCIVLNTCIYDLI